MCPAEYNEVHIPGRSRNKIRFVLSKYLSKISKHQSSSMHFFSLYQVTGVLCTLEMEYLPTSKDISGYSKSLYFGDTDSYPALEKDATRKAKETGNSV